MSIAPNIDATLTHGEIDGVLPGFTRLGLVAPPLELAGFDIELQLADGAVITGWMSTAFLHGKPTYWTHAFGNAARCVDPVAWRASDAEVPA